MLGDYEKIAGSGSAHGHSFIFKEDVRLRDVAQSLDERKPVMIFNRRRWRCREMRMDDLTFPVDKKAACDMVELHDFFKDCFHYQEKLR